MRIEVMRPVLVLLVCLFVPLLATAAQPSIGPEIVSGPQAARNRITDTAAPAVAMAKDRHGVAIAWTMPGTNRVDAIHVARIDSAGGIVGAVIEMPTNETSVPMDASSPSIAASPSGAGFTVAWIELYRGPHNFAGRIVYCQLDASLTASAPRVLTRVLHEAKDLPVIVRSGKSTWIAAANLIWPIQDNGTAAQPLDAGTPVSDMTADTDFPRVVSGQRFTTGFECRQEPGCKVAGGPFNGFCYEQCRIYSYAFALRFVSLYTASTAVTFPFESLAQPAIEGDGEKVLIAWLNGNQATGGTVNAAFASVAQDLHSGKILGTFGPDETGVTRPDIATDGERYVVVWRTTSPLRDHDIQGAMMDRAGNVTEFSVAASGADERDPSVIAVANGTFLVAYEKIENGERRIAGRFVRFVGRRRAA